MNDNQEAFLPPYNNNQNYQNNDQQNQPAQRRSTYIREEYDDGQRQRVLKKRIDSVVGEITFAVILSIVILLFVAIDRNDTCNFNIQQWMMVTMGYYLGDVILLLLQYHKIMQTYRENLKVTAIRFFWSWFLVSWLIYGNVKFFNHENDCKEKAYGLNLGMLFVLAYGYLEILKCCCMGTCVCIMIPILYYSVRRAQRPNWIPAPPNFVQNLVKSKFDPSQNTAFDQCAICLVEFNPADEIVPLPCDAKHYFHPACIQSWLEKNNNCPLCKKPITQEALNNQRQLRRGQ